MNKLRGARGEVQTTAADSGEVRAQVAGASRGCARLGRRSAGETISTGLISYLCAGGLLALGALSAAGCGKENNVTQSTQVDVGKQCSGPEDKGCGPGGVCVLGVCRHGCETDASCERGALCLGDRLPFGCSLPSELACSSTQPCEAPLSCAPDGKCRMPCSSANDCPRNEHLCIAGTCVSRSDAEIDAWQSCETGERVCDGNQLLGCNEANPGWGDVEVCGESTPYCSAGVCGDEGYARWFLPGTSKFPHSYTADISKGVVLDNITELLWQRDVPPGGFTLEMAGRYCTALRLGGRNDWRLPNRMELLSLVDYSRAEPAVDINNFPAGNFGDNDVFWTSSQGTGATQQGYWSVDFRYGSTFPANHETNEFGVRCVTDGGRPKEVPKNGDFFRINPYGNIVEDVATGLEWQRGTSPSQLSHASSKEYCENLELEGDGWRLPSVEELNSLVASRRPQAPTINVDIFPGTQPNPYWSSSRVASNSDDAWFVGFGAGWVSTGGGGIPLSTPYWARCVR